MRLLTVRARLQPLFPNHIVNDFTFEGIHRLQVIRLAGILHCAKPSATTASFASLDQQIAKAFATVAHKVAEA